MRLAGTKKRRKRVVLLGVGVLVATAWFSFVTMPQWGFVTTQFTYELSQNLFFVCWPAIILLWIWKVRNDPEDRTAARLVAVLAVYFSLYFLVYHASQFTFNGSRYAAAFGNVSATIGLWLPLGCGSAAVSDE